MAIVILPSNDFSSIRENNNKRMNGAVRANIFAFYESQAQE